MGSFAIAVVSAGAFLAATESALAQRLLGIDVSAWQGNLSTTNWNTLHNTNGRDFVFIRASRGGTTGFDHDNDGLLTSSANCNGVSTTSCLSNRYDDPYFGQNITRATNAGLFAGPYHRIQAQIIATTPNSGGIANTGTDEADHFMQMAGAWMRPGYLPPVLDFEDGDGVRTDQEMAQFALDFSNRIYAVMEIRPAIYTNGNYAQNVLGGGTTAQRSELAQQSSTPPGVVSPAFPTLWSARWPNQGDPNSIDVQNLDPTIGYPNIYGPWDDYGVTHPWAFWQYASTARLSGYNNGNSNIDVDVSHGDIEYVKDQLVPALWWTDGSGDWSTLANWNSGQALHTYNTSIPFDDPLQNAAPFIPPVFPNMSPVQGSTTLPTPRLPGAAGNGPTAGSNDTVILERPNANITVTLSSGTHNIRKLYMRETLNITGGSLMINYDPNYVSDTINYPNALRSGSLSAQFSGPVTLSGTGSLSVNTLQVDATRTFTLAGSSSGTLTFKQINLMPHSTTPAKIAVTGDVNISPLNNGTATIANGGGAGSTGFVDLGGGTRIFNVGNGAADVDLDVVVPITNGGLTKNGTGTMRLSGNNTFNFFTVTINAGVLRYNNATGLNSTFVTVNNGGTLDMNNISDTISLLGSGAGNTTGIVLQGAADLTIAATSGFATYFGTITGTGMLSKTGEATQTLYGDDSLGPVSISAGKMHFNGTNTTGNVTVGGTGVLGGTGSMSGAVTVNSGGHVAPGSSLDPLESFGVGALALNAGSVLDFEFGAGGAADLMNVTGLLTLNSSSLNLTDLGGLSAGTYTLIDYGTLSGDVANLGAPNGPSNFNYHLIDTGTEINLLVSILGDFNLDGAVDGADYSVWRKGLGTTYTPADFNVWRAHFGEVAGSGSSFGATASVPEPAATGLLLCAVSVVVGSWRRRPAVYRGEGTGPF
jgi:GH25 family lysozyme M1 (1,4-beta-N-acetylmuramidase)